MDKIVIGGVYKSRSGLEAVVYWKPPLSGNDQHHVRDKRGYNWSVHADGTHDYGDGKKYPEHPLDLIGDTGRREDVSERRFEYGKWKNAPENSVLRAKKR